jgi:hypothetical protein
MKDDAITAKGLPRSAVKQVFLEDIWQAEGATAFLSFSISVGFLVRTGLQDATYWFCGATLALYGLFGLLAAVKRDRGLMGLASQFGAFVALVNIFAAINRSNYVSVAFFLGLLVLTAGFWLHREVEKTDVR